MLIGNLTSFQGKKKWAQKHNFLVGFYDESGLSERPFVHTTWATKGKTPVICSSGSWKRLSLSGIIIARPSGRNPKLFLRSIAGNINAKEVLRFLKELKRHLRGRKLLLFWDGLSAHRAGSVLAYIKTQKHLRIVRFPAYAPELNPIEYLWSAMKTKYLSNLPPDFSILGAELKKCYRKMRNQELLYGFLKASELY